MAIARSQSSVIMSPSIICGSGGGSEIEADKCKTRLLESEPAKAVFTASVCIAAKV